MKPKIESPEPEAATASTVESTVAKPSNLKPWPKGVSGNPAGRKKGSRNRINEKTLVKLEDILDRRGDEVFEKAATAQPMQFVKTVAGLLPTKIDQTLTVTADFESLADFAKHYRIARQLVGLEPPDPMLLELEAVETTDEIEDD